MKRSVLVTCRTATDDEFVYHLKLETTAEEIKKKILGYTDLVTKNNSSLSLFYDTQLFDGSQTLYSINFKDGDLIIVLMQPQQQKVYFKKQNEEEPSVFGNRK